MASILLIRQPYQWVRTGWRGLNSLIRSVLALIGVDLGPDLHTRVTFRAVTDAVIPETPELADELGPEHVPGGIAIGLDEFVIEYIDNGFQFGLPDLQSHGNLPMAGPIANLLDTAALKLVQRDGNEDAPSLDHAKALYGDEPADRAIERAAGPFAQLTRQDRLRAISILDELELELSLSDDDLFELDGGQVSQLVVGFLEMIYYSEWQGYEEFHRPPSERTHANDPSAIQSWRQTGYPGVTDGYSALRGYVGKDDSPLGEGETWRVIDAEVGVHLVGEPGRFRENEYDTSGYEEPFPVESE